MFNRLMLGTVSAVVLSANITPIAFAQTNQFSTNGKTNSHATLISQNTNNVVKTGSFASAGHPTTGGVQVVNRNGQKYLVFNNNFKTDNGPALYVILHKSNNLIASTKASEYKIKEGDYVTLTRLQKTNGTQEYLIPNNVDLDDYKSVAVWCEKFNVTFGAATLN